MYINNDINYVEFFKEKSIIVFGAGSLGRKICKLLINNGIDVIYFCDNDSRKNNTLIDNISVIDFEKLKYFELSNKFIVIASTYEREIQKQLMENEIYNYISCDNIDLSRNDNGEYYDENYFQWQREIGEISANMSPLKDIANNEQNVLEFGSGGGYLLNKIQCKNKLGVEINDFARENAEKLGIRSVKYINEVYDNYADLIISTHVLEHVEDPLSALKELRNKLKANGKIVFIVPHDCVDQEYSRNDINNHIFTWNCLTIGNLFKLAGYFVYSVERIQSKWPENYKDMYEILGDIKFKELSNIVGKIENGGEQIKIVAYKN